MSHLPGRPATYMTRLTSLWRGCCGGLANQPPMLGLLWGLDPFPLLWGCGYRGLKP